MKKLIALALALTMALGMTACSGSSSSSSQAASQASSAASEATSSEAVSSEVTSGETVEVDFENSERLAQIRKTGKIVLGTSADYPPFEFHTEIDGTDTIVGFDVLLAQKVADALGVELEVVDMSFDNLLIGLNNGDFDFVMASLSNTPERAKAVDFSSPYFYGTQVVVIRAEDADKYTTQESLAGCAVAAQRGAIQVPIANKIAGEENVVQLVKVGDMITELKQGKVEAVFLDNVIAGGYDAVHDDLVVQDIGIEYESDGNVAACRKDDDDLTAFISSVFDSMSEEEINALLEEAQAMAGITEE
ncbi:MAG: transporter substrate-binding domain-containing protein [Pygmaiobacter massiliensis]|nr:transporter substrate-binding domain-containing protein [Pygmaiobacter massiliensis]